MKWLLKILGGFMGLHDIDKKTGGRIAPTPNQNDSLNQRLSHGTTQMQNSSEDEENGLRVKERQIVAVQDGVNKAVFGFYGEANKFGFKVAEDGVDVLSATDDQLLFNSEQNVFKIKKTGTISMAANSAGTAFSTRVAHGLTTTPAVLCYARDPDDSSYQLMPYTSFDTATTWYQQVDSWVDNTYVHFQVENSGSVGGGHLGTWTFKYYILQESVE